MSDRLAHITFISAGAGSGKTYRLTEELEKALVEEGIPAAGIIGTTFTVKAASELKNKVHKRLISRGYPQLAEQMSQARLGTVHSVCERLLKRFAFELGLSPRLNVVALEDGDELFSRALDDVLDARRVHEMNRAYWRLGLDRRGKLPWQMHVKEVADTARSNDIAASALPGMGLRNVNELLEFFPAPGTGDLNAQLIDAVRKALDLIDTATDTTKGTARYVATLRSAIHELRRFPLTWRLWMKLSKAEATKKSEPIADTVRSAAAAFAAHPQFHNDVRSFIQGAFQIAADTLNRFADIKAELGLIDFNDMEQLALRALDDVTVQAELRRELRLLLVDEFQDTNPMQLALFMKLAELTERVVFVGDVKQAIYSFRGCDPGLVLQMLHHVREQGGQQDVLEKSWRSRPPLVEYINTVFGEAFDTELPRSEIKLRPVRTEQTTDPALIHWTLSGRSNQDRAAGLAEGVAELVASGHRVVDPEDETVRPVSWGDIAVLAATNDHVEKIAKALRTARVPMKMTLKGLLSVPEISLARACLRRLNDPTDTLATAEIIAMAECADPTDWLADRLSWLKAEGRGNDWGVDTHPVLDMIQKLRAQTAAQSPVEIVARVLNYVGIRESVTAWGPDHIKAAQRQRNLDAFLNLAVQYEDRADGQNEAATLTGFLFWLENPHSPELDLQPVVTTGDAVHVLTYHKAKGLEWPVVVATDLHYRWNSRLWNVRVEPTEETFEVERPLSGRTIRWWPNLFGRNTSGIDALDKIMNSQESDQCRRKGESENRRLAYVGLTRARDTLILAEPDAKRKSNDWLGSFEGQHVFPTGDGLTLPDGTDVPSLSGTLEQGNLTGQRPGFAPRWFVRREPAEALLREALSPSEAESIEGAAMTEVIELGARMPVNGNDMTAVGNALHAIIAAELVNPDCEDAVERARKILVGWGAESYASAADADNAAKRFRSSVVGRFRPTRILAEYPIRHRQSTGQIVKGWVDVLLQTDDGWVIIDHKSSPRPKSEWEREVAVYSGQLLAYRQAVEATGESVASCWVHLPISGGMVRMQF